MSKNPAAKQKRFLVSIVLFPSNADVDRVFDNICDHLELECGIPESKAGKTLLSSVDSNRISIVSSNPRSQSLEKSLLTMRDRLKAVEMMNRLREIGCADTAYVSIGVIYRTVTCTVRLSPEALAFLSSLQLPVEIASYPASDD